ncbi:MAG: Signal transduction histidine-protein kinase/phosphatase DegS [Syntrophorhabdus sp. PtaU1.Bin058]|nr:MAG: Signal transduction histidine-protein kinase/phosphatase DegS [Syntrophorhabdus sp. PtaU1.Bin058]
MRRKTSHHKAEPYEEKLFKTLADNLQVGVYIIQKGKFQFINLQMQDYAGYTEAEMLTMDPLSIIHPGDRETAVKNAVSMLKGVRVAPYGYRLMTKQGQIRWIMETATPIVFKGEKAVLSSSMDITEQKETKESLRELNALKSSILDAIPQAVVGLQNRRINFANDAVEEVFGWRPGDLIGKSVTLFYRNEKEADEIGRYFYTTLEHQRTFVREFWCRHKDGHDILCRMRSSRIGERLTKERRIVVTYEDITEQRRAEEELTSSREQLRNLSAYLQSVREKESTRIAREIHDELGQSLSAIQMDLIWLETRLPAADASLAEKVQRMRRLVDTTVDSVHRISTELRPILLDDLGLTAAMEWQVQEFQVRTGVQCEANLNCNDNSIEKDLATTFFRIFQETLTNIARHAEATHVKVRLARKGDELCLDVSDNGKGITPKQVSDTKSFGIMGIRERVNLWGGSVNIIGKSKKGTMIKIRIPMRRGGY